VKKLLQVLTLLAILTATLSAPTRVWAEGPAPWPHLVGSSVWADGVPWPHLPGSSVAADSPAPWPHLVGSGVWAEQPGPWPHLTCLP
jgi:hypothetical protein